MLYTLGKELRPLADIDESIVSTKYGQVFLPFLNARVQVQALLASHDLSLKICAQAARQLLEAISGVVPEDISEAIQRNKDDELVWWHVKRVKDAAQKFETVLAEELNILDTYAVAQKGAYSTSELVSNAEVIFPESVRKKLPPRSISDIREAGKCLAFETPTAAAFHIVRAIESVIVVYYAKVLGDELPPRIRNWGVYIKKLRESGKADARIVEFLDHIRGNYRNPVSHPEETLTVDEVLVLLSVAVGAMTQMGLAL